MVYEGGVGEGREVCRFTYEGVRCCYSVCCSRCRGLRWRVPSAERVDRKPMGRGMTPEMRSL